MSKNKIFISIIIWFLFWVFFWNILFDIRLIIVFFSILTIIFCLLLLIVVKKHHFIILIFILWIFLWLIYSWINNINISKKIFLVQKIINKEVVLEAEVLELYKKSQNHNLYILKINKIDKINNFKWNFLFFYPKNFFLEKWQVILIKSKINKINNFSENFNYEKFLLTKNIYFQVYAKNLEILDKRKFSKIDNFLINFRKKLLEIIYSLYPKNEAIFLSWLLIWAKENMPKNLLDNFNNSWLTHLISVSWFNITIIIIFLWFLFKFFPIILRTFLIFLIVIIFILIVWNNIPTIRAWIMWLVWYFILVLWRKADSLSLLLFTSFLIILYNPLYINYDISFHLSFLAVLWLLFFQDFWSNSFKFIPNFFAIKDSFVLTMSALTTTLPIMIFNFWQISILAPITNMLVWWVIPFAMLFWFLSILWQLIIDKLWFIIWFLNFFILKYIILIAEFFWNLKFSILKINLWEYWIYLEIIYFLFLLFFIFYTKRNYKFNN